MSELEKCSARLDIGDDYSDNAGTMRCELIKGHKGAHQEIWTAFGARRGDRVMATLQWIVTRPIKEAP